MNLFDVYPINPISIERASGSYIWDQEGTRYLDLYGGHAVISIGHSHPYYIKRIKEQLDKIGFYSNSIRIPQQEEYAEKLKAISGKEDYALFLCNSGAEANENAFKLASFYNGRKKIIAFDKAFHGRTSLAVSATDNPSIVAPVNETENVIFLPFNDVEALNKTFMKYGDEISSVIIEGIQGVGGIREASKELLQAIRKNCDKYDSIFIADSIQCGYGRTGSFFSHDYHGVSADIYTMAKGMGNGFPIGGVLIHSKIQAKHGMLGTTFGGNHLACAAALAVVEVIKEENLLENAKQIGNYLLKELRGFSDIREIRGRGLMIGVELDEKYKAIRQKLLDEDKMFTGTAKPNIIRILPALNIDKETADRFLQALQVQLKN